MTRHRVRWSAVTTRGVALLLVAACSTPTVQSPTPGPASTTSGLASGFSTSGPTSGSSAGASNPLDSGGPFSSAAATAGARVQPSGAPTASSSAGASAGATAGPSLGATSLPTLGPGPAVRFSVTGLVEQRSECYAGINCTGFPPADYPRQIATITALDAQGRVAT